MDMVPDENDMILSMSPITPKAPRGIPELLYQAERPPQPPRRNSPFQFTPEELNSSALADWTPEMVAQSMFNAGIELSVAERFIENDINGPILITLKFEDLRELDISSFGIRTKVWHQIQALRDSRPASPRAPTPIEDKPSREVRREERQRSQSRGERSSSKKRTRKKSSVTDVITPGESVSIIGIEQVIPKPHVCSKGENCSKWRKQARLIEKFKKMNPNIDINAGGTVMIVGDAGNPETARAIDPNEEYRPVSDAEPSVVASSDVLGTNGMPPLQYLQETSLRNVQYRDPQDNVRQFLQFQRTGGSNEVPPTPPFETVPAAAPHHGLRRLPKLAIPGTNTSQGPRPQPPRAATVPPPTQQQQQQQRQQRYSHQSQKVQPSPEQQPEFVPYQMQKAEPRSPDLETPRNPYRFGTPFSEMDVPVTAIPPGPVARDISQSVPPDMNYRVNSNINPAPRAPSRAGRRPSFPVLPALEETQAPQTTSPPRASSTRPQNQPLQPPPRANYPWSPAERTKFEKVIPPGATLSEVSSASSTSPNDITYQGHMKKRKAKILRHEWQDGYFTLKGTRLNMHKDAQQIDRTLEYVDIDDYAIACSSLASSSKLSAALKAVSLHSREKSDPVGAFQFQLIPQDKNGARLRKRDSALPTQASAEGVNGTGKTHHFAVKNRDERIDWMREMMLAKALKQKGEGFEISVNGSMI